MSVRICMSITFILIVFLASCGHGFVQDTSSDPCSYTSGSIVCSGRNLTSIPVFNLTRYEYHCPYDIVLNSNKIQSIKNDDFMQLRYLNCSYSLWLQNNKILSQIDEYAFRGVEKHIHKLYLDANSLHSLPEALGSIINLRVLSLSENPIVSLNPSVMAKIGHSVQDFTFTMASLQQWPSELRFLNQLQQLLLDDMPFESLDSSAFRGLTHVDSLTIRRSKLKQIPNAVCTLSALTKFEIYNNYFLNESKSDVFEPCSNMTGRPHIETISFLYNRVDYFPNMFAMFSSVNTVYMYSNGMQFMDPDMFEDNFSVQMLSLHTNQFRRIPSGLTIFKILNALIIDNNLIETIEDNDLIGLHNLTSINLANNPIRYITNKAFQNNMQLKHVDLSQTLLKTIPAAVTMLPALHSLGLKANAIECTCELASLKSWNVSSIQMYGLCYQTDEPIDKFIKTFIDAGKC